MKTKPSTRSLARLKTRLTTWKQDENRGEGLFHMTTAPRDRVTKLKHALRTPDGSILLVTLLASATILWIIFYPTLRNMLYLADDLQNFTIPLRHLYADGLHAGRIDIWTPALFYGFYAHGEGQMGMFHPFHLLLYRWVPFIQAFGLELSANYLVLWIGSYALFYRWTRDRIAAAFGAFFFTFAGPMTPAIVHVNEIAVIAHIPWTLFALDCCMRGDKRRANYGCAALALLNGSMILLGYPYYFVLSLLLQVWYASYLIVVRASISSMLRAACGTATGLMIGAIQLLPTWQLLRSSSRAHPSTSFLAWGSLHRLNILQWANPYFFQGRALGSFGLHEISIYAGTGPLLLFLWLCTRKHPLGERLPAFLLGLAFAGLFLSLGENNHVFPLYCHLPGFNIFRMPCRFALVSMFAFAGGSALALKQLRNNPVVTPTRLCNLLVACLFFLSLVTVVWRNTSIHALRRFSGSINSEGRVLAGCAIVCTGIVLFRYALRYRGWWLACFCIFAVCDVGTYSITCLHGLPTGGLDYYKWTGVPVQAPAALVGNSDTPILGGYSLVNGYAGLQPPIVHSLTDPKYLQALGVTAMQNGSGAWTTLTLPPAAPVRFEQPVYSAQPLEAMNHVDLTKVAIVAKPVSIDTSATGSVRIAEQHPGFVRIDANSSGRMFCVLVQRFYPGWTADMDGKSLDLMTVDGDLTGFVFPGGQHNVTLVFHPKDLTLGRDITGITLLLLAIALLAQWTISRRMRPNQAGAEVSTTI